MKFLFSKFNYSKEDAKEMEQESLCSADPQVGLSMQEKKLLKRLEETSEQTFQREFGSSGINRPTINLDQQ